MAQLLYTTTFDATGEAPYDRLLGHIRDWVNREETWADELTFTSPGEKFLLPITAHTGTVVSDRVARWHLLQAEDSEVLRLDIIQVQDDSLRVITRITVENSVTSARIRIGIARESLNRSLTPVDRTRLFQPGLVRKIADDTSIRLVVNGQPVDTQYLPIRTIAEVPTVASSLSLDTRLPILLVHLRSEHSWTLARAASNGLVGLARVLTLNTLTVRELATLEPRASVPFGGALLAWPGVKRDSLQITAEQLQDSGAVEIRDSLFGALGSLSALSNGTDLIWREAKSAADSRELEAIDAQLSAAQTSEDTALVNERLITKVNVLSNQLDEWREIADSYAADATRAEELSNELALAQDEAKYWRTQFQQSKVTEAPSIEIDPWEQIPMLESGINPVSTFFALSDAAANRIEFTDNAGKSWTKSRYPDPADMTEKLILLAKASADLYGGNLGQIGHLDNWFKETHGLNVAMKDQTISQDKALRWFSWDGEERDGTPHVKVRDGVKPNEVGRIHFALDPEKKRLIVNHVALKLYGI